MELLQEYIYSDDESDSLEDDYHATVKSKEVLLKHIAENMFGFKLYNVAGNGLCVVNSFRKNIEVAMDIHLENETLLNALHFQLTDNSEQYKDFVVNDVNLKSEVELFIQDPLGNYNTTSCDMYLIALAKHFQANISVIHSNTKTCWESKYGDINADSKTILYFAKTISDHIDPILPDTDVKNEEDIRPCDEPCDIIDKTKQQKAERDKKVIIISDSDGNSCSDSDVSCNIIFSGYRSDANSSVNDFSDSDDDDLLFSTPLKGKRKISDSGNVTFQGFC